MNREQITGRPVLNEISFEGKIKSSTEKNLLEIHLIENRLRDYYDDPAQKIRRSEQTCRVCYYLRAEVETQNFIKCKCEECKIEFIWGNSNIPKVCLECAVKYNACRWCYGDIF
jgi:phage FluMu protein Com